MYALIRNFVIALLVIVNISCNKNKKVTYPSITGYNLNSPYRYNLREELDEISGIVFYSRDTTILAINDENGILYKIYPKKNVNVLKWKFDRSGDFEDLALVDSVFYALKSNGDLISFQVVSHDSVFVKKYSAPYKDRNEFETLYYDPGMQKLVLICKDCEADNKKQISAMAFDPDGKSYLDTAVFILDAKLINEKLKKNKEKIKPSAAAIHPITKELYIISSVNKVLVIAGLNGEIKIAVPLNPRIFKQPEGIAFTPKGDMIVSNEAADSGPANILIFKYKSN